MSVYRRTPRSVRLVAAELAGWREFQLTAKEYRFVEALVLDGLTPREAARKAGYGQGPTSADPDWRTLMARPRVNEAIRAAQVALVQGDLANVALSTLRNVMEDRTAPAPARVQAARTILQAARLVGHGARDGQGEEEAADGQRSAADLEREHKAILSDLQRLRQVVDAQTLGMPAGQTVLPPSKSAG